MRRSARVCLVLFAALSVCGCPELQKLRRDNKELNDKLAMARQQIKDLEEQNALMRQDNDQLKSRLLKPPAKPAGVARKLDMGPGVNVRTQGDKTIIELQAKVFFQSGSVKITPKGRTSLKKVAALLKKEFPGMMYRVEGHTDSDPIRRTKKLYKSNWELSTARALAVLHHLIDDEHVNPRQVCAVGFGQYQPRVPNTSATNKSKNRRVEIVVTPSF